MVRNTFHEIGYGMEPIEVPGFPYEKELRELIGVYRAKLPKNKLRNRYYEGKNVLRDLGIAIPDDLKGVEMGVGWPRKAVDALAVRSRFDGFSASDPDVKAILDSLVAAADMRLMYRQAVESELIYSCEFLTVSLGGNGEPGAMVAMHSAETAAAVWDFRRNRIKYGIAFVDFDKDGPTEANMYLDDVVVNLRKIGSSWDYEIVPFSLGRPLMEPMPYRPTHARPFGQSRITRAVRDITDEMVRECLRTCVQSELFSVPQKYLLGIDKESTENVTKWERYIGSWVYASRDEDGNIPTIGMLQASSMSPHLDYQRALAARFSGETDVPVSTLGVLHDQAASAESIYAASEGLIIACQDLNEVNRRALSNVAKMAVAAVMDEPLSAIESIVSDVTANFANPAMPSIVSQADAMVKVASAVPGFAGTDVFFEQLGFSEDIRRKVMDQMQSNANAAALRSLITGAANDTAPLD